MCHEGEIKIMVRFLWTVKNAENAVMLLQNVITLTVVLQTNSLPILKRTVGLKIKLQLNIKNTNPLYLIVILLDFLTCHLETLILMRHDIRLA